MTTEPISESSRGCLQRLFDANFLDYTAYVVRERAIPDVDDGLKPVQRRILQTLFNMDDGRFHKVANVVGDTMKLHPHGDTSIFAALVNLANKGFLIDRQGNFGNIYTGDQASAARYIECRLSPLARETLFNKDLTRFVDSYDGRMQEPISLPSKVPLLLMLGAEGIAVGMATRILPHNFCELLQAQIAHLRGEDFTLLPDFYQGGIIDAGEYNSGNGRIRCRARLEEKDDKTIIITELPAATTTTLLIESVEKAAKTGKIKIISINDYTAEKVEIEIKLVRGIHARDTINGLFAFTDCEVSIVPNLTVIRDNMPVKMGVEEVLRHNTDKLVRDLECELNIERDRLLDRLHARTLEQIFIEERLYKQIEEISNQREVLKTVRASLEPFKERFVREVSKDDLERLLEIRIRRISRYDINRQQREIKAIEAEIAQIEGYLQDMVGYTIGYIEGLLAKYGAEFPRRSEIGSFDEVDTRKAALANIVVGYHRDSGFLGSGVKTENPRKDLEVICSEYDKLLLIHKDGMYKVIGVEEKIFAGHELLWLGKVEKAIFNLVYRDGGEGYSYVKRFNTPKFILGREYRLFPEHKRSAVQFLALGEGVALRVRFAPSPRAKYNAVDLNFDEFLVKGPAAKGKRIATRTVRSMANISDKTGAIEAEEEQVEQKLPGMGEE